MKKQAAEQGADRRRCGMKPLKVLAALVAIAAVIKELRLPKEDRTWHGALGGYVPYDFRMPTVERIKAAIWDPDGAIVVNRPFGVGWSINFGAIVARVRSLTSAE